MSELPSFKAFCERVGPSQSNVSPWQKPAPTSSMAQQSTLLTPKTSTRQQQPGGLTRSTHIVPGVHQTDPNRSTKVAQIAAEPAGSAAGRDLNDAGPNSELDQVLAQYNMNRDNLADLQPKMLGGGGSTQQLVYNPQTRKWRVVKS